MTDVGFPILIYGAYMATEREYRDSHNSTPEIAATYPASCRSPNARRFSATFTFIDITATARQSGRRAGLDLGLPEAPVRNVLLRKRRITGGRPFGIYTQKTYAWRTARSPRPMACNQFATTVRKSRASPANSPLSTCMQPRPFIHDDFLLSTRTARRLYHEFAEPEPILDYHCHLSPRDIAENRQFKNLFEIWLEGDHYKWRAMRANGVPERFCTGDATPLEKFKAWAATVPHTLRNPLYHWTHLELARYFGITELLDEASARTDLGRRPTNNSPRRSFPRRAS